MVVGARKAAEKLNFCSHFQSFKWLFRFLLLSFHILAKFCYDKMLKKNMLPSDYLENFAMMSLNIFKVIFLLSFEKFNLVYSLNYLQVQHLLWNICPIK